MIGREQIAEVYSVLRKNPFRTFLTGLGVSWGIFMVVALLGAVKGLKNGVMDEFGDFATNSFYVWAQSTTIPYMGLPKARALHIDNDDVTAIREQVKNYDILAPRNQLGGYDTGSNVTRKSKAGAFDVMGDYPSIKKIRNWDVPIGRFINQNDIDQKRKVAAIGPRVQEVLFDKGEDPVGKSIEINGVYFKVIGVFKPANSRGRDDKEVVAIPFTTFQNVFNFGNKVAWLAITSKEGVRAEITEQSVLKLLSRRHKVHPNDRWAFGHFNLQNRFEQRMQVFKGIDILTIIVGIGSLLAGVIGVSNIMLIVVKERTKEIGIRRAIGARPLSVINQVILESVTLTTITGLMGLAVGVGVIDLTDFLMQNFDMEGEMFKRPEIEMNTALWTLAILVLFGALAGIIPANRAVGIKPVEAIRTD